MKQIFDGMREQIEKVKTKVFRPSDVVWNNAVKMCLREVDEAEAKWEAEGIPIIHGKAELELHDAEIRQQAITDFMEHITLPLTTEEDIARILEQLEVK